MSRSAAWLQELRAAVPPDAFADDPDVVAGYSRDMAMLAPNGRPAAVVFPASTREVSTVLRLASAHRVPVVPRGAGSGLSGSANGVDGAIILSMVRMNAILELDPANRLAVVQPGVINKALRDEAEAQGLFYPPDPASFDWCTIGGNLSTDAGGLCCVKYGVTSDFVLGIEVVLADGEVLRTGHRTVKGVAGYDLARLFVGSEGTLGVITEVTLALPPKPQAPVTLVATFNSTAAAGRAVEPVVTGGLVPSLLELMDRTCIRAVDDVAKMDLDRDAAALLVAQSDSGGERAAEEITAVGAACERAGAAFVHHTADAQEGAMLLHAGDGNMHPTICFDPNDVAQHERAFAAFNDILEAGLALGGTVTGEHGVGNIKIDWLAREIGPVGLRVHAAIKAALDPLGIMNPGKIFTRQSTVGTPVELAAVGR